jgi:hypothetical protein
MDDVRTQAQLVTFDPARAGAGAIGTVVSRAEFAETAARGEFPATFLLDLDRIETADGGEVTAHATVAVDWDKDTLDQLLTSTKDEEIALWFDKRELARAFDDGEVEGHGLRQRAAVLAVAVVAAGASAAPSLGAFPAGDQAGGPAVPPAAFSVNPQASGQGPVVQPAGAERGLQQDERIAVDQAQSTSVSAGAGGGGVSSGDLAAAVAAGALLITAAGFGATRKRVRPVQPA